MTLDELKIGESATVTYVGGSGSLRQHFLDMGLIPGSVVTLEKFAQWVIQWNYVFMAMS